MQYEILSPYVKLSQTPLPKEQHIAQDRLPVFEKQHSHYILEMSWLYHDVARHAGQDCDPPSDVLLVCPCDPNGQ